MTIPSSHLDICMSPCLRGLGVNVPTSLCVRLRGCFDKLVEQLLERSQWNRNLPTLRLTLKTKIAAKSRLVVAPKSRLRGLFPRWGAMIPARVATGKNSRNAAGVASE